MVTTENPAVESVIEITPASESDRARQEQFRRNIKWFQQNALEIGQRYSGKCICISNAEIFVADTAVEALALATAAHPGDEGRYTQFIRREKGPRIYAN